ncbi:MAG: hypothetical protein KGI67_13015 [Pseudomonadota bacterium]|nr:hypothetical protein [Pseudomonadota bacterium]
MSDHHLAYLLGYPASFCVTPDEARSNILRMIEAEIPGWNGGAIAWAQALRERLARPNRTRQLNRYGARFSAVEWVWVMRSLLMDCERLVLLARESDGGSGDRACLGDIADRCGTAGGSIEQDPDPDAPPRGTVGQAFVRPISA